MKIVFDFFGGRKAYAMHLALLVGSIGAAVLGAGFVEFGSFVALVLGLGNFSIAYEDRSRDGGSH